MFVIKDEKHYALLINSSRINASHQDSTYNDLDGTRIDMGCYPYNLII